MTNEYNPDGKEIRFIDSHLNMDASEHDNCVQPGW